MTAPNLHVHSWHEFAVADLCCWLAPHQWGRVVVTGPAGHARLRAALPTAEFIDVPNRGADCAAFLAALNHVGPSDAVWFKAHTKREPNWRSALHGPLFAPGRPRWIAEALTRGWHDLAGTVGMWVNWHEPNTVAVWALCRTAGVDYVPAAPFVGGTVFAVSPRLTDLMRRSAPRVEDFEEGHAVDGQLAHAWERFAGVAALSFGRPPLEVSQLG